VAVSARSRISTISRRSLRPFSSLRVPPLSPKLPSPFPWLNILSTSISLHLLLCYFNRVPVRSCAALQPSCDWFRMRFPPGLFALTFDGSHPLPAHPGPSSAAIISPVSPSLSLSHPPPPSLPLAFFPTFIYPVHPLCHPVSPRWPPVVPISHLNFHGPSGDAG